MGSGITVATPCHPPRLKDGRLAKALESVATQTLVPETISLAIDTGPVMLFAPRDWRDALAELEGYPFTTDKRGAWYTRQRALDAVTSEWVQFLDSDDWLDPEHCALHLKWAEAEAADYVYSWFQVMGSAGPIQADPFPPEYFTEPWWPDRPRHTTMTVMVRTELAKRVGFTPPIPNADVGHEDWKFTLGCYEAGAKIVHIPGVRTWRWGWHHENTSGLPTW